MGSVFIDRREEEEYGRSYKKLADEGVVGRERDWLD